MRYDQPLDSFEHTTKTWETCIDRAFPGLRKNTPILLVLAAACWVGYGLSMVWSVPLVALILFLSGTLAISPLLFWPLAIAQIGPKPTRDEWQRMRDFQAMWLAHQNKSEVS